MAAILETQWASVNPTYDATYNEADVKTEYSTVDAAFVSAFVTTDAQA